MRKPPKIYKTKQQLAIRRMNPDTGIVTKDFIEVEAGTNAFYNTFENEKGTLLNSPIAKIFGIPSNLFKPK